MYIEVAQRICEVNGTPNRNTVKCVYVPRGEATRARFAVHFPNNEIVIVRLPKCFYRKTMLNNVEQFKCDKLCYTISKLMYS